MSGIRSVARVLVDRWFLVLAVVVNLAIAAPLGAVRWNNDVCADGDRLVDCCTTCWFFCSCEFPEDGSGDGSGDDDIN